MEQKRDKGRYAFKKFTTAAFKPISFEGSYSMYTGKVKNPPEKGKNAELKRKKVQQTSSGRSRRKLAHAPGQSNEEDESSTITRRKSNETRATMLRLKHIHPLVTLLVGSLDANLRQTMTSTDIKVEVQQTINTLVRIMSTAKRLAQLGTDLLITKVMEVFPYNDYICNKARMKLLTSVIYGKDGGKTYHQNLLRMVISGTNELINVDASIIDILYDQRNQIARKNNLRNPATIAYQLLKNCYTEEGLAYRTLDEIYGKLTLSRTLQMLSAVMDTDLATHIKGRLPLVKDRVT